MNIETKYFKYVTWYTGGMIDGIQLYAEHKLLKVFSLKFRWSKEVNKEYLNGK